MAGVLKTVGSLFTYQDRIGDANNIDISGIYRGAGNNTNTPNNYGILVSFVADDYRLQIFVTTATSPVAYIRMYFDSTWGEWTQL